MDWKQADEWLQRIDGWLSKPEAVSLYLLAQGWPGEGDVVELGSYLGRSTVFLAAGIRERRDFVQKVITVDSHMGAALNHLSEEGKPTPPVIEKTTGRINTFPVFRENLQWAGVAAWVDPWICTTQEGATLYSRQRISNGHRIRVLFIDADHKTEAVRKDVHHWAPIVMPGGVIVLHDFNNPDWPGPGIVGKEMIRAGGYELMWQAGSMVVLKVRA